MLYVEKIIDKWSNFRGFELFLMVYSKICEIQLPIHQAE